MTNHPNRSQRTRRVYLLNGRTQIVTVMDIVPARYEHEIGSVWSSGPTYNNRPAALNLLTDDLKMLDDHLARLGFTYKQRSRLNGLLEAADAGDEFGADGEPV